MNKEYKLISMVDFVLEYYSDESRDELQTLDLFNNYAHLFKQKEHISMFVPINSKGEPMLGKPLSPASDSEWIRWENEEEEYRKALENVLFKGFYTEKGKSSINNHTIYLCHDALSVCVAFKKDWEDEWEFNLSLEDIAKEGVIELTETAINKIGYYETI